MYSQGSAHRRGRVLAATLVVCLAAVALLVVPSIASAKGFDEFGYNRTARVFVGTCLSWGEDRLGSTGAAEAYCGTSVNDRLVMKWNRAWDECNEHGNDDAEYCGGAWLTNEWSGSFPGGSGETAHYKFIWIGSDGESSEYWQPGGEAIWGTYEWTLAHGTDAGGHWWWLHARPNGLG